MRSVACCGSCPCPPPSPPPLPLDACVQALLEMFEANGVPMPLQRAGPAAYTLNSSRAAVRLLNGRLVVRGGAGQAQEITAWLERQPLRSAARA